MTNQIDRDSSRLEFLKRGQFPDQLDSDGANKFMKLALYLAVRKGNVSEFINAVEQVSIEMQIPLSAIFKEVGPAGDTLLHEAVTFEHNELTAILASHFPFLLSMKNILGDTILHVAAKKGSLAIVQLVIAAFEEHFPDSTACEDSLVRMKNEYGNTALHEAVINIKADVVEFLVNKDVETWYWKNDEGKSPLFLAIESGDLGIVKILLEAPVSEIVHKLQGHSPVHAAIMKQRSDMLKVVFDRRPELYQLKGVKKTNPLHLAVRKGYLDGIKFLLSESICSLFEYDEDGQLRIHIVCTTRHFRINTTWKLMKELLGQWPNPSELLDKQGRNILHIAAMNGRHLVVSRMLGTPELGVLINQRDKDGNTPIHLATFHWYPMVLYYLAWDKRAEVNLENKQSSTAMDFVVDHTFGFHPPLRKRLTHGVLHAAGAHRSKTLLISKAERWTLVNNSLKLPPCKEYLKDQVNSRLIMATLVATITFAAGFIDSGGHNSNQPNTYTPTKMNKELFGMFVISNTIAVYTSVLVIIILLYAQVGDSYAAFIALNLGSTLMSISLITMSLGFMAGTHVALDKHSSLAHSVLLMGIICISLMLMLTAMLYIPFTMKLPVLRQLSYTILLIGICCTLSHLPPTEDLLMENSHTSVEEDKRTGSREQ